MRQAENAIAERAQAGRAGAGIQRDHYVTRTTGEPGGAPDGTSTRIKPGQKADVRRSLELENSAAAILADRGYRLKQNPTPDEVAQARLDTGDTGKPTSKPDYLLEGRVFDCYSPVKPTKNVRGIWSEVEEKIVGEQTQRVVVNLEDWRGDMAALHRQFDDWPIDRLKELKAITPDGEIIQILPRGGDDRGMSHGA
jgi:hypothetical protein